MTKVPLQSILPNRFQPRQTLDESKIQELANSIKESGLIYPLLVRKSDKSGVTGPNYELIAGERRFRALKLLGESEATVIVRDVPHREALELSLIENIQRQELNPIEEASAFERLIREFEMTQDQVAQAVAKDRATVANTIRLLKLPEQIRTEVAKGRLSLGHARALLSLESQKQQLTLAMRIIAEGLSVRRVEQLVKSLSQGGARHRARGHRDPHLVSAQEQIQRSLGTKVEILHGRSRGWIKIAYFSLKELDRLLARLT
ncbi:MAG: ParB/RepB/Spo0J family partition protein [Candidatus Omnitrophica bacterium]|nr:ParB/RepB/Spo0J family partition protein [Candidatus Omnitrophota bacterium]